MKTNKHSLWLVAGAGFSALYFGSYVFNSYYGGYFLAPDIDGKVRYSEVRGGMGMPVAILWQPYHGYYSGSKADLLGKMFTPCILIDRSLVHSTRYLTDEDIFDWIDSGLDERNVHPSWRTQFAESKRRLQEKKNREKAERNHF
jgi:hypothetical protein